MGVEQRLGLHISNQRKLNFGESWGSNSIIILFFDRETIKLIHLIELYNTYQLFNDHNLGEKKEKPNTLLNEDSNISVLDEKQ